MALVGAGAVLTLQDGAADVDTDVGDFEINSAATTNNLTRAVPSATTTGTSTGVGVSVALNIAAHDTRSTLDGTATLTGANDVGLSATSDHAMFTAAKAGVKSTSGTAVGGSVAPWCQRSIASTWRSNELS